jgi:hypothetical protein
MAEKLVEGRKSDGQFDGCDNLAWIITEAEWDSLSKTSAQPTAMILDAVETAQSEHDGEKLALGEQDDRNRNHPGYCTKCHTYCYGDCESN